MTDKTISSLSNGGNAQYQDRIPIARSPFGLNDNAYLLANSIAEPYVINRTAANLRYFGYNLARAFRFKEKMTIGLVGDSLTLGSGAVYQVYSPGQMLANDLTRRGFPAKANLFGNALGSAAAFTTFEPRIVFTGTWTNGDPAQGKFCHKCTSASGTMTYTPGYAFNTVEIYWQRQTTGNGGGGDMTITVDAGATNFVYGTATASTDIASITFSNPSAATATVSQAGSAAMYKTVIKIDGSLAAHTITLTNGASNNIQVWGLEPYTLADPGICIRCMGSPSYTSANISAPGTMLNSIWQAPVDVWFLNIGANDMFNSVPTATLQANIATLISNMKTTAADVVFWTFTPIAISLASASLQETYVTAQKAAAATADIMCIDMQNRWQQKAINYELAPHSTYGWYTDTSHPSPYGCHDIASSLARSIVWEGI